jgi:gluconolactonase
MQLRQTLAMAAAAAVIAAAAPALAQSLPGERPADVTAIDGVVAGGAKWTLVLGALNNMDGIVGLPDGGVIFAQEQNSTIRKVDRAGKESVYLSDTHGGGSVSVDAQGRLFVVQRTCTDPGLHLGDMCKEPTAISQYRPTRKVLTSAKPDGSGLGRINDIVADGKGGAFFTSGGAFHVSADGKTTIVEDKDLRSNGIMLSRDGRTLYVTNNTVVIAFDVGADGSTSNRRDFASLDGDTGGDGMAIDNAGRLYVTANAGVHVFSPDGKALGVIPTPRRPITLAFSGPDKKTLYVVGAGAVGPDGKAWTTPEGVRNTAMTLYRLPMLAEGFKGRPK